MEIIWNLKKAFIVLILTSWLFGCGKPPQMPKIQISNEVKNLFTISQCQWEMEQYSIKCLIGNKTDKVINRSGLKADFMDANGVRLYKDRFGGGGAEYEPNIKEWRDVGDPSMIDTKVIKVYIDKGDYGSFYLKR